MARLKEHYRGTVVGELRFNVDQKVIPESAAVEELFPAATLALA